MDYVIHTYSKKVLVSVEDSTFTEFYPTHGIFLVFIMHYQLLSKSKFTQRLNAKKYRNTNFFRQYRTVTSQKCTFLRWFLQLFDFQNTFPKQLPAVVDILHEIKRCSNYIHHMPIFIVVFTFSDNSLIHFLNILEVTCINFFPYDFVLCCTPIGFA